MHFNGSETSTSNFQDQQSGQLSYSTVLAEAHEFIKDSFKNLASHIVGRHGVIYSRSQRVGGSENTVELISRRIKWLGRRQSGFVGIHKCGESTHLHFFHLCSTWKKDDCHCRLVRSIRHIGLSVKWERPSNRELTLWATQVFAYLHKRPRQFLHLFINGQFMPIPTQLSYRVQAVVNQPGLQQHGHISHDHGSPYGVWICSGDQEVADETGGPTGSDARRGLNPKTALSPQNLLKLSQQIERLIGKEFPSSLSCLTSLSEYTAIVADLAILYPARIESLTLQTWNRYCQEWLAHDFATMLSLRAQSTFDPDQFYSPAYSLEICKTLLAQQFQPHECSDFIRNCIDIVDKNLSKKNTLSIVGPPGSGKTYFLSSLTRLVWLVGYCESSINRNSTFPFENLFLKRLGVINEFNVAPSQVDNCKELFQGQSMTINVKYKSRQLLPRTPIFITSNSDFLQFVRASGGDREALEQRMFYYQWASQSWLKELDRQIHPHVWMKLADTDFTTALTWQQLLEQQPQNTHTPNTSPNFDSEFDNSCHSHSP